MVMDDHHRQMELNLIHHQLPPCPYVIHFTIENFVVIINDGELKIPPPIRP